VGKKIIDDSPTKFQMMAINIPPKIKFKEIVKSLNYPYVKSSNYEVVYKLDKYSYIILYSFGVYVLINTTNSMADEFKEKIRNLVGKVEETTEVVDTYQIIVKNKSSIIVDQNEVLIPSFKIEYLRIIALVLSESVAIDYFEVITDSISEVSIQYSRDLKEKAKYSVKKQEIIKFIGHALVIRQKILANLYITDAPEEAWNNPELEKLFLDMSKMFDIEQRFRSINMSLNATQESLEIITNLIQNSYAHRLEIYIIILIMMEFGFSIISKFIK